MAAVTTAHQAYDTVSRSQFEASLRDRAVSQAVYRRRPRRLLPNRRGADTGGF